MIPSFLNSLLTLLKLPAKQKPQIQRRFSPKQMVESCCIFLLWMLCASSVIGQPKYLPNFTQVAGTVLSNTNGNWVRVDPAQPNNIDLVESRIFKTPPKGSGISAVEFKLIGADGGTAHYQSGLYNQFANGGRGGEITFTLKLVTSNPAWGFGNRNTFNRAFLVTFGKKGESTKFDKGLYCSAGGGGSTGMSWLVPGGNNTRLGYTWSTSTEVNQLIAGAGGGSGGFAALDESVHGNSAGNVPSASFEVFDWEGHPGAFLKQEFIRGGIPTVTLVSGGSGLDNFGKTPPTCCTPTEKMTLASSVPYTVFNYQTGVNIGSADVVLTSVTQGQGGGKPTVFYPRQNGTPNVNNTGMSGIYYSPVIKHGGRGGSGMAGGGAGCSTTDGFDVFAFFETKYSIPTSGAGGIGSFLGAAQPQTNLTAADAGTLDYSDFLENVSISPRTSTNAPQSGYFMYRTIKDTEPPVITLGTITINLGNGKLYPFYSSNIPLTMATLAPYIGIPNGINDNDAIKSITFSQTELTCSQAGQTIPLFITVTDFAGNSTDGVIQVSVKDPFKPVPTQQLYSLGDDLGFNAKIDVTSGPYSLTAANFPKAYDGCNSSGVITNFPPTTFDCSQAGIPQTVTYYYTDKDGNKSANYTKTFNVVYTPINKLYVDHTATGANNGSSWADAFTSLQTALQYGCSTVAREIYVAKGTYYPASSDRNATFTLRENDKIYGGFPNGGDLFTNRKPEANPVILSGELISPDPNDNSYHVVTIAGNNTLLEGFTIRDGYADSNFGGGLILQQTENYLTASHWTTIRNCKFLNNYASKGGAIYADHRNQSLLNYLNIINCLFENNSANDGGAVYLNNQTVWINMRQSLVNCVFRNNSSTGNGGALHTRPNSEVSVTNCTFSNNNAGAGGALYNLGTTKLHNSILYFNTVGGTPNEIGGTGAVEIDYSNIQGSGGSTAWSLTADQDKGHNIDTDPLFYTPPFTTRRH